MREIKEALKYLGLWLQQKFYQGFQPQKPPPSSGDHIDSVIEVMGDYELRAEKYLEEEDDTTTARSQD